MKIESLVEVIGAAHQTWHIHSKFPQRGGIMLIAPPATLKSTIIKAAIDVYPDSLVLSDINVKQLVAIRDDLGRRYHTLGFTEFEKLYQRNMDTSANIEGHLKALVEEGFDNASFEDQRISLNMARCMVVGALTPTMYRARFDAWIKNGFARRFLWCNYTLHNPMVVVDAIHRWERIAIEEGLFLAPAEGLSEIPFRVSDAESYRIRGFLKYQPGEETPYILMKKILCILKWQYHKRKLRNAERKAMETLGDFAQCLGQRGATLIISSNGNNRKAHHA